MRKFKTYFALCLLMTLTTTVFAEEANTTVKPEVVAAEDIAVTVNGSPIKQSLIDKIAAPQK